MIYRLLVLHLVMPLRIVIAHTNSLISVCHFFLLACSKLNTRIDGHKGALLKESWRAREAPRSEGLRWALSGVRPPPTVQTISFPQKCFLLRSSGGEVILRVSLHNFYNLLERVSHSLKAKRLLFALWDLIPAGLFKNKAKYSLWWQDWKVMFAFSFFF